MLLAEPGLIRGLPQDPAAGDNNAQKAFMVTRQLLRQGNIETRKAVHELAPWLLAVCLEWRAYNDLGRATKP